MPIRSKPSDVYKRLVVRMGDINAILLKNTSKEREIENIDKTSKDDIK